MSRGFSRDLCWWTMDLDVWVENALGDSETHIYTMPKGFHLWVASIYLLQLDLDSCLFLLWPFCPQARDCVVEAGLCTCAAPHKSLGPAGLSKARRWEGGPGLGWGGTVQISGKVWVLDLCQPNGPGFITTPTPHTHPGLLLVRHTWGQNPSLKKTSSFHTRQWEAEQGFAAFNARLLSPTWAREHWGDNTHGLELFVHISRKAGLDQLFQVLLWIKDQDRSCGRSDVEFMRFVHRLKSGKYLTHWVCFKVILCL